MPLCHEVEGGVSTKWAEWVDWAPPAPAGLRAGVTVVIPASRGVPVGLGVLRRQSVDVQVIVLANGPRSGELARELASTPGLEVVEVPWEGHGKTRNRALDLARYPYLFYTVDDCLPLGAGFLERLIRCLEQNDLEAVTARQLPWPDSDPVTRRRLRAWTPPGPQAPGVHRLDNVGALYRRESLIRDPFPAVPIAEDTAWATRHRVGYAWDAPVVHAHPRGFLPLYRRTVALHTELIRRGQGPTVPDGKSLLRALPTVVGPDLPGALGELLGQWRAGRARCGTVAASEDLDAQGAGARRGVH